MNKDTVIIRYLGRQDYASVLAAMQQFTTTRTDILPDELWCVEHDRIFTQGQNGKAEHLLNPGDIPVIRVDRGGQVTYHGPGQIVIYTLVDLKRKKLNIRQLVTVLEQSVIALLAELGINAIARPDAPGVYVNTKKICSVGLRIRRGCSYHGLAFNFAMDLEPFTRINPCGFPDLQVTQLVELIQGIELRDISTKLITYLVSNLGYNTQLVQTE